MEKCPFCIGWGHINVHGLVCPACLGTGTKKEVQPEKEDRCPECGLAHSSCDKDSVGHYRG